MLRIDPRLPMLKMEPALPMLKMLAKLRRLLWLKALRMLCGLLKLSHPEASIPRGGIGELRGRFKRGAAYLPRIFAPLLLVGLTYPDVARTIAV
jgi:hypothetical protein